jgi:hypothetical protein
MNIPKSVFDFKRTTPTVLYVRVGDSYREATTADVGTADIAPNRVLTGSSHFQVAITNADAIHIIDPDNVDEGFTHVLVQFNGGDVRVVFDADTDPTASFGFWYKDGGEAYLSAALASAMKVIAVDAAVTAEVQLFY